MKVDKLKRLPSGKYKIIFDNDEKMITYDDVIIKNSILYNKEIDKEKLDDIYMDTEYYNIYNKAINYISKRKRSIKEIKLYFDKFDLEENQKEEIITRLKENGFLNDNSFVASYIADKIYLSNVGPYKIKKELLSHDISEEIIDEALSKINDDVIIEKLKKTISKKISINHKYSNYILKQKIVNDLNSQGFDKEMTSYLFDTLAKEDNSVGRKEFDKAYTKLSKKYQGKELRVKLKQKLYQKGFSFEQIESLLKEINE